MVLYRENFDRPSQEAPAGPQAPVRIRRTSAKVPASLPPSHHSDNRARSTSSTPAGQRWTWRAHKGRFAPVCSESKHQTPTAIACCNPVPIKYDRRAEPSCLDAG